MRCDKPLDRAGAEGEQVNAAARLGLKHVETGKSWVFISANLKRPASSARSRLAYLARQLIRVEFERGPAEPAGKAKK